MKAFPRQTHISDTHHFGAHHEDGSEGMDLRDYFAAKAMQGIISCPEYMEYIRKNSESVPGHAKTVSMYAYIYADKMMEARK